MPWNLFAACRENDELISKRIRLDNDVQQTVQETFEQQERSFRDGVTREVAFDGSWKPEEDELLTLNVSQEARMFVDTVEANAVAIADMDLRNFDREGIHALFTGRSVDGNTTVLVQQFSSRQMLSRKFPLVLHGNSFRRLSESAFTLDTSLTCIMEEEKVKFKSFHKMRRILSLYDAYREATAPELRTFVTHVNFEVGDRDAFIERADQTERKLIHAIMQRGTLDAYDAAAIEAAGRRLNVNVVTRNGKILLPNMGNDIKQLLRLLDDGLYRAELTGQRYQTNSKQAV